MGTLALLLLIVELPKSNFKRLTSVMLKELINQFYANKIKDQKERSDHFYISDAGKCPRQIYFKFKKAPRAEIEPRILRIFDEGDYVHLRLMGVLTSLGIVRAVEVQIPPQEIISGRADAIVGLEGGKPYVVDFKSISNFGFKSLQEPKQEHVKQIQLYMHYFKIPRGILLYESKDTQELKDFLLEYDPELIQRLLKGFEVLKKQIEENTIPAIPPELIGWPKWPCQYCEYLELCQKKEKSKLKKLE